MSLWIYDNFSLNVQCKLTKKHISKTRKNQTEKVSIDDEMTNLDEHKFYIKHPFKNENWVFTCIK